MPFSHALPAQDRQHLRNDGPSAARGGRRSHDLLPHSVGGIDGAANAATPLTPLLGLVLTIPAPNPSPVKREGLKCRIFPFPSLRGEGAGVRGHEASKSTYRERE